MSVFCACSALFLPASALTAFYHALASKSLSLVNVQKLVSSVTGLLTCSNLREDNRVDDFLDASVLTFSGIFYRLGAGYGKSVCYRRVSALR